MTRVTLYYHEGTLTGIESRGHSGFARNGSDIVCAAVSVLMQSLILGLEDIAKVQGLNVEKDERVPVMRATWPSAEQERISLLTETTAQSLRVIAADNPRYVKLSTEEI